MIQVEGVAHARIGIDIGGTFTDLLLVDDTTGEVTIVKTLTTPTDPSIAVDAAVRQALTAAGTPASVVGNVIHGTTLVTNAIIERKGDPTALITTKGFRDVLEIRREHRYDMYDLSIEAPREIVPRVPAVRDRRADTRRRNDFARARRWRGRAAG